ncbi:MAG: penicillin-binding transpeptidase domain-containing protein [Candidatus Paceibacterota bacterium]|nr:MAG: penicillin-binding transpeptidase domain-containing protein [Candidatus Paceibacterota bacterium]
MAWWSLFKRSNRAYAISLDSEDWVAPEETLVDVGSSHVDLERPVDARIFMLARSVVGLVVVALVVASGVLAIHEHRVLSAAAEANRTVQISVSPPRGAIVDRTGVPLVKNTPSFQIAIVSRELPATLTEREALFTTVATILKEDPSVFVPQLLERARSQNVFFAATGIPKEATVQLAQLTGSGVHVITTTERAYLNGEQFSTILGYTARVSVADRERDPTYAQSDRVGRAGIEAQYEQELRGTHGSITFSRGEESVQKNPVPGHTVVLEIDAEVQRMLYNSLFSVLQGAAVSGAAAIAQDPHTGAVLGMVSFPSYDNNMFADGISQAEYQRLFTSSRKPLFNRVIGGTYNPGSTIKPFIGMAAVEENIIRPSDNIWECVNITIPNPSNPSRPYVFENWRPEHGPFNLARAIATSCNIYFFTVGGGRDTFQGLGIERIASYLQKAFADKVLGIDLPGEVAGFVPTSAWKQEKRGEPWYQGDTYNVSIGQGDLSVSPLWINAYVSAIANGGVMYQPRVAQRIQYGAGTPDTVFAPTELTKLPFSGTTIAAMKKAMRETVLTGTAKLLQGLPVSAAAKTGTAEVTKHGKINSLFTAFAPVENPKVAITVLVETSVYSEGYAIRTAYDFLKWFFTRPSPASPAQPLPSS